VPSATPQADSSRRRTQAERSALSDSRMTAAAVQLIAERGVAGTTLAAIGEAAGYSRGLATHRFGSKAGLLRHVIKRVSREWLRRLDAAVGSKVGLSALEAALDTQVGFIREAPNEVRAMYLLWFQSIEPNAEYRPNVAEVHRQQRETVAGWIAAGQAFGLVTEDANPRQVAEYFCGAAAGLVFHWLVNPQFPVTDAMNEMKAELAARLPPAGDDARRTRTQD
jgi:AcrR family transcriptional regulator